MGAAIVGPVALTVPPRPALSFAAPVTLGPGARPAVSNKVTDAAFTSARHHPPR